MMPRSSGWYDDPDGSNAERYWNGRTWTPERRRKGAAPAQPPAQNYPPTPPAYQYPTVGPPQNAGPGPDPSGRGREPASRSGGLGTREIVGLAIAVCGLALVLVAFAEWGRARIAFNLEDGEGVVSRASFPGVGDVKVTFNSSDLAGELHNIDTFHNTNPGWVAIVFGVLALAAGIAIWRTNYRNELAIATAALGVIAAGMFIKDLIDIRGTFGDQSGFAGADLTFGIGLLAACALSAAIAGLGIAAFVLERRHRFKLP